jgi:hypothetical protein
VMYKKIIYVIYIDVKGSITIQDMNRVMLAQGSTIEKINLTMYRCDFLSKERGLNRVE